MFFASFAVKKYTCILLENFVSSSIDGYEIFPNPERIGQRGLRRSVIDRPSLGIWQKPLHPSPHLQKNSAYRQLLGHGYAPFALTKERVLTRFPYQTMNSFIVSSSVLILVNSSDVSVSVPQLAEKFRCWRHHISAGG